MVLVAPTSSSEAISALIAAQIAAYSLRAFPLTLNFSTWYAGSGMIALLTVLALSMGAPFWFDLLNKFMNVRYTGKSPDETSIKPEKQDTTVHA